MSDSSTPIQPARPATAPQALSRGDVRATILDTSGDLRSVLRPTQIDGVVTARNSDGTATISTSQGDIRAILRSPQQVPQGQAVQIDLQPGRPPRQAVVRIVDQPASTPPETSNAAGSNAASSPRSTAPASSVPTQAQPQTPARVDAGQQPSTAPHTSSTPLAQPTQQSQQAQQTPRAAAPANTAPPLLPQTEPVAAQPQPAYPLQPGQAVRLLPLQPGAEVLSMPPTGPVLPSAQTMIQALPETGKALLPSPLTTLALFNKELPPTTAQTLGIPEPLSVSLADLHTMPLLPSPIAIQDGPPAFATLPSADFLASFRFTPVPQGQAPIMTGGSLTLKPLAVLPEAAVLAPDEGLKAGAFLSSTPVRSDWRVQALIPDPGRMIADEGKPALPSMMRQFIIVAEPHAGALTATVEGFTRTGLPIIALALSDEAPPEQFVLQFHTSNLTVGARLNLLPQPLALPEQAALAAFEPLEMAGALWPALQDVAAALTQAAPQAAPQVLAQAVPNPSLPAQLPPAALLFIAAVQSGDIGSWLGSKAMDTIRRADKGADLIARLTRDVDAITRMTAEPLAQDWKAMPLPFYNDGRMQGMMLWYRRDDGKPGDDDAKPERKTRFVFDFVLSRMGPVQLDGLAKEQRIDLIIRTRHAISPNMRQAMRQQYLNALEQASFSGELSFQDRPEQFVHIDTRKTGAGVRA